MVCDNFYPVTPVLVGRVQDRKKKGKGRRGEERGEVQVAQPSYI